MNQVSPEFAPHDVAPQAAAPSAPLLHPVSLTALVLLVANDHFLKSHHPSWLTGKLSDVAFMILAPLWLSVGFAYLAAPFIRHQERPRPLFVPQKKTLLFAIVGVGAFFTSMQLSVWGDFTYRVTLGALQWPARAAAHWLEGASLPPLTRVVATPDPTDLICLPFLWVAWELGKPRDAVS